MGAQQGTAKQFGKVAKLAEEGAENFHGSLLEMDSDLTVFPDSVRTLGEVLDQLNPGYGLAAQLENEETAILQPGLESLQEGRRYVAATVDLRNFDATFVGVWLKVQKIGFHLNGAEEEGKARSAQESAEEPLLYNLENGLYGIIEACKGAATENRRQFYIIIAQVPEEEAENIKEKGYFETTKPKAQDIPMAAWKKKFLLRLEETKNPQKIANILDEMTKAQEQIAQSVLGAMQAVVAIQQGALNAMTSWWGSPK